MWMWPNKSVVDWVRCWFWYHHYKLQHHPAALLMSWLDARVYCRSVDYMGLLFESPHRVVTKHCNTCNCVNADHGCWCGCMGFTCCACMDQCSLSMWSHDTATTFKYISVQYYFGDLHLKWYYICPREWQNKLVKAKKSLMPVTFIFLIHVYVLLESALPCSDITVLIGLVCLVSDFLCNVLGILCVYLWVQSSKVSVN